jgi:polysaccharide deacetylase 2 family uncharacterized protein YibQ
MLTQQVKLLITKTQTPVRTSTRIKKKLMAKSDPSLVTSSFVPPPTETTQQVAQLSTSNLTLTLNLPYQAKKKPKPSKTPLTLAASLMK